jgi:hypothetical protein
MLLDKGRPGRAPRRPFFNVPDVLHGKPKAESSQNMGASWVPAFEKSKWFTRGWTLQELIVSKSVEFFSMAWRRLGDKSSLEKYICKTISIPPRALQGAPLYQFRVEQRIFWAEHRQLDFPKIEPTLSWAFSESRFQESCTIKGRTELGMNLSIKQKSLKPVFAVSILLAPMTRWTALRR